MSELDCINKKEWKVKDTDRPTALSLVEKYHYSKGGANTGVAFHGLYKIDSNECMGVAWYIPPTKLAAQASFPDLDWRKILTLHRLVIHPDVPRNAGSFLLSKSVKLLRERKCWSGIITYADTRMDHDGTIYKASNWKYDGLTRATDYWFDPLTGRQVARKAGAKTRRVAEMKELGYEFGGNFSKHRYKIKL